MWGNKCIEGHGQNPLVHVTSSRRLQYLSDFFTKRNACNMFIALGCMCKSISHKSSAIHVMESHCCSVDWCGYKAINFSRSANERTLKNTVYPQKYAHGFVVLCFVVVMQSFIINSHEVFIHIHQGCFAGTGAIVRFFGGHSASEVSLMDLGKSVNV